MSYNTFRELPPPPPLSVQPPPGGAPPPPPPPARRGGGGGGGGGRVKIHKIVIILIQWSDKNDFEFYELRNIMFLSALKEKVFSKTYSFEVILKKLTFA